MFITYIYSESLFFIHCQYMGGIKIAHFESMLAYYIDFYLSVLAGRPFMSLTILQIFSLKI